MNVKEFSCTTVCNLSIDTNSLTFEQARQAEYLSVLAKFNQLKAEWLKIAKVNGTVKRGMPKYLVELGEEVQAMTPDWRFRAWSLSEISRRTKVPIATLRRWANEGLIRSEKRGRDWYMSLNDVEKRFKRSSRVSQVHGFNIDNNYQ